MDRLPNLSVRESLILDLFCALVVYKIYNKYEVDPANFIPTFLLLVGVPAVPSCFLSVHMESKILAVLTALALFYVVLISSVVLYRISPLHPLAKYPGPLSLKISQFAGVFHALRGDQHLYWKSLHEKYGPYLRVGPNALSIIDANAIPDVLGVDGMRRGPQWAAHMKPGTIPSIVEIRDVSEHHERRKLWTPAFTSASLKELQTTLEARILQLVEEFNKCVCEKEQVIDLRQWMAFFSFDFMGDMVFGGGFELLRNGDTEGIGRILEEGLKVVGVLQHIPWITGILNKLISQPEGQRRFTEFGTRCHDKRKQAGPRRKDLFLYITNEEKLIDMEVVRDQALNEVFAAIVAGADSTATVLAGLFYYLLTHPDSYERLRNEVDSRFPRGEGEPFDSVELAKMPYLNAVINEALRLQPPLPTSLQRSPIQGSGGKLVAGRFLPESTAVYVPPYIIQRDERYFSPSPNEFIPERWLDKKSGKFVTNSAAYIPFSYGPANCVGKNLALLELRMLVATIIQKFDIRLAEGYDAHEWEENVKDHHLTKVGRLPVLLSARN